MPRRSHCLTVAAATAASPAWGGPRPPLAPGTAEARRALATELDAYLWKHVLAPRFPRCVDETHGGFHVNYARDWSAPEGRSRFIVYEARVTWTAAAVARLRPDSRSEYLPYVRHGVRYLRPSGVPARWASRVASSARLPNAEAHALQPDAGGRSRGRPLEGPRGTSGVSD